MTHEFEWVGDFQLTQPIIRVSDPGYVKDCEYSYTIEHCLPGKWEAAVVRRDTSMHQVAMLAVRCIEFGCGTQFNTAYGNLFTSDCVEEADFDVDVDSGLCGVFDDNFYADDNVCGEVSEEAKYDHTYGAPWYSMCCETCSASERAGTIPYGAVSNSGAGDGCYPVYYTRNRDGYIHSIAILFVEKDEWNGEGRYANYGFETDETEDDFI